MLAQSPWHSLAMATLFGAPFFVAGLEPNVITWGSSIAAVGQQLSDENFMSSAETKMPRCAKQRCGYKMILKKNEPVSSFNI